MSFIQSGSVVLYDNKTSVMTEDFRWMSLKDGLVPAWVARGTTPSLEKKKYDPWNPNPTDPPVYRVYYLSHDGVRSVEAPTGYHLFARLESSREHLQSGAIPVLFTKGYGADLTYAVGEVRNGKVENFTDITLPEYRSLLGVNLKPLTGLSPQLGLSGTVFPTDSYRGAQRITAFVDHPSVQGLVDDWVDAIISPVGLVDAITRVAAVYQGQNRSAMMTQTLYDAQYNDLATGESAVASLRRFSFLSEFHFFKSFFSVVLNDSTRRSNHEDRLPGLWVSPELGLARGHDVIVPRYGKDGHLKSLVRPARLRFEPSNECLAMGNEIPATRELPTQLVFLCNENSGDMKFIRVPLEY